MARGESGYVNSAVQVVVGGVYNGGGAANYVSGQTYAFRAKLRESDFSQQRQDTTDSYYREAVGGPVSRKVNMTIYYKGAGYPPDFTGVEVALFRILFGGSVEKSAVVLIESFKQTGDVEKAIEYTVTGESDGAFN